MHSRLHLSNAAADGPVQSGGKLTATPQCRQNVYSTICIQVYTKHENGYIWFGEEGGKGQTRFERQCYVSPLEK